MSKSARQARLFRNDRNQAVRIPREFELAAIDDGCRGARARLGASVGGLPPMATNRITVNMTPSQSIRTSATVFPRP